MKHDETGPGEGNGDAGRSTIWVVDDEPDILELYREILEDAGYRVETVPDGETLIDRVFDRVPDLVLLDINMPGMSGWEARRRLREDPRTGEVPVIAVTAVTDSTSQASAVRTFEFADFITKPFRIGPFLETIEQTLDGDRSRPSPKTRAGTGGA